MEKYGASWVGIFSFHFCQLSQAGSNAFNHLDKFRASSSFFKFTANSESLLDILKFSTSQVFFPQTHLYTP